MINHCKYIYLYMVRLSR